MQGHSKRGNRSSKGRSESSQIKHFFKKIFDAFCQLSDPAQTIIIIGMLLLLAWLLANPMILANLVKAFLGLVTMRATFKSL